MKQNHLIIAAGAVAVFGGALNAVSDYYLQGGLSPGPGANTFEQLNTAPFEAVYFGSMLGYAALPLWFLGLWPLYYNLRPAGRFFALVPILLFGFALACIPGYHHSYVLYAAGFQSASVTEDAVLIDRLVQIHTGALSVFQIPFGLACIWVAILILRGKTWFPRWMFIVSPMLTPLTQPLIEALPSPWGGYIRPPWGTMIITSFFAASLWVYYKKTRLEWS